MGVKMKTVAIFQLQRYPGLDKHFAEPLDGINCRSDCVSWRRTKAEAHEALQDSMLTAVLIWEPSIMEEENLDLAHALAAWTKAGGRTIIGICCGIHASPPDMNRFFKTCFDLPWETGDVNESMCFSHKRSATGVCFERGLPTQIHSRYGMRWSLCCTHEPIIYVRGRELKNVLKEDAAYMTPAEFCIEPRELLPTIHFPSRDWSGKTPVVYAQYYRGRIGWVGDTDNAAQELHRVYWEMLGLFEGAHHCKDLIAGEFARLAAIRADSGEERLRHTPSCDETHPFLLRAKLDQEEPSGIGDYGDRPE